MVDRTIAVRLRAEIADFKRNMDEAAKYVDKNASSIDTLSSHVGLLGTALTGFAALAVTRFAQFDKQMSSVQAATRSTGAELDSLRQAAIRAGADTAFSATEAAAGIEELAKAGVSTTDILNGGLTGALNLAAAGNLEVADAAQIASVTLKQFNLQGADVSHIADLLAAGAGKAVGSVSDLSQALNQSGLIASQTGLSIEETTAGLSAFASAGLLGSDAGTSFKTMLQVLSAPSTTAATEMDRLGISAYDAQGNFIGLEALAGNLRTSLAGLTDEQKNAALATIFGSDAVRAASVLYKEGALGIQQWTDAVDQQGFAAEQARIQSDNLIGDLERLGGSFDTVLIQSGSGANDSLRLIVQAAEAAVDALGQIPAPALQATTAIAGAGGLALLGIAGMGKLAVSIGEVKSALDSMNLTLGQGAKAAAGLGVVLAGVGVGLAIMGQRAAESQGRVQQLAQTWDDMGNATTATNNLVIDSLSKQTDNVADGNKTLIELADQVGVSVQDVIAYIEGEEDAISRVNTAIDEHQAYNDLWLTTTFGQQTQAKNLSAELGTLSEEYQRSKEVSELDARAKEAGGEAAAGAAGATQELTGALQENTEALDENWQAQMDASGAVLELRDAESRAEAAYDSATEAVKDNGRTLDVTTEKGRANRAALDDIASSGFGLVDSLRASGASLEGVQGAMATARKRYVETARAMGLSKDQANALADSLGLIPKNVTTTVAVNTGNALAQINTIDSTLNRINGKVVTAGVAIKQYGQAALATGGRLPGFPTGGRLPGIPPANPMADNLLGVDGAGMPKVRVRSREWVVNEPAADYYGDGIMGMLNARAIPREAIASLPGLATGGEVRAARSDVLRTQRALEAARRAFRRSRTDRNDARRERAQEAAEAARDRYERLRDEQDSVRTQLRRGEVRDSVTGGLSGALGVTDQLRNLADSGDFGRLRSRLLDAAASKAEKNLSKLYAQAEKIEKRLEAARDRVQELASIQASAQSAIAGGFSLADSMSPTTNRFGETLAQGGSGKTLLGAAQAYAAKAKTLSSKIRQLQERGFSGPILAEVASQGVEGGAAMADALLGLNLADTKALNDAVRAIDVWGSRAGAYVTEGFYDGGVQAARGLVKGLESQEKSVEAAILRIAKSMEKALKTALGIKSPSRVFRSLMRFVGEGSVLGLQDAQPAVARAAAELVSVSYGTYGSARPAVLTNRNPTVKVNASVGDVSARLHPDDVRAIANAVRDGAAVGLAGHEAAQDRQAQYVGGTY